MKPAALILRDLQRAHRLFLMHHDVSLSSLFLRLPRQKFVAVLSRYWDLFLSTWNVSLHGNPAMDIYQGINIAASGELGVGVGEEERGSGEREVLEGLVGRTEGLVDLVVSKFGADGDDAADTKGKTTTQPPWLGSGREPQVDDGVIFLGTGALSRKSLRDVTHWMEDLYSWGEHAYGVIESPISTRRARPKKKVDQEEPPKASQPKNTDQKAATESPNKDGGKPSDEPETSSTSAVVKGKEASEPATVAKDAASSAQTNNEAEDGKLDKMVSYLKLGYGQYWSIPGVPGLSGSAEQPSSQEDSSKPREVSTPKRPPMPQSTPSQEAAGHYLIGLKGEIEEAYGGGEDSEDASDDPDQDHDSRTVLRAIHVELQDENAHDQATGALPQDSPDAGGVSLTEQQIRGTIRPGANTQENNNFEKLRVVVYVNRPFIFVFLFRLHTDSLAWDSLYRSLHYQLSPLRKPLLASTQYRPERPDTGRGGAPGIYDLVWNPLDLTVHSTVPNIPDHLYRSDDHASAKWSRADAVNTHLHVLNVYSGTRSPRVTDLERTQKTSRGWWIVWTRLVQREAEAKAGRHASAAASARDSPATSAPPSPRPDSDAGDDDALLILGRSTTSKEIFLIRRASDHASSGSGSLGMGGGGLDSVGKLAQGIGVDTRRYVEDLLSML